MPRFHHLEIWSDYQCAGGALIAGVPDLKSLVSTYDLTGDEQLQLGVPRGGVSVPNLAAPNVARVVRGDGSWREWRVAAGTTTSGRASEIVTRIGRSPLRELARGLVSSTSGSTGETVYSFGLVNITAAEIIDAYVLPALAAAGYGWWERGTIDFTDLIDQFQIEWQSPLQVLNALKERFGAELGVRDHGTTGKYIDVVAAIGAGASKVRVRTRKQLLSNAITFETINQATRVFPRGAKSTGATEYSGIARILCQVTAGGGSPSITIADPGGVVDLIAFDDEFAGWYAVRKLTGRLISIGGCSAANQQLFLGYDGVQNGEWLELRRSGIPVVRTPCMEHLSLHRYARVVSGTSIVVIDDIASGASAYDWITSDHQRDDLTAVFCSQVFADNAGSYNAGTRLWTVATSPAAVQVGDLLFYTAGGPTVPPFAFGTHQLLEVVSVDPIAKTIGTIPHYAAEGNPVSVSGPVNVLVYRAYGSSVVNNSYAASNELWLANPPIGINVGDMVLLEAEAGGTFPISVDDPVRAAAPPNGYGVIPVGVDAPDLHGEANLVPNPLFRIWTNPAVALPDGWTIAGGAYPAQWSRNTDPAYIRYARGQSLLVTLVDWLAGIESIVSSPVGRANCLDYLTLTRVTLKVSFYISIFRGDASILAQATSGDGSVLFGQTVIYSTDTTATVDSSLIFGEGQFVELTVASIDIGGPLRAWAERICFGDVKVVIKAGGSTTRQATVVVDGVALYHTANDPGAGVFLDGSGCNQVLDRGHRELKNAAAPSAEWQVQIVDLERLNGATPGEDELQLGGLIEIVDTEQNETDTQRLVRLVVDELDAKGSQLTLASRQKPLTTLIATG